MSERLSFLPSSEKKAEKPKEPIDVRLLEKSGKLDMAQIGIGLAIGAFNPVLGTIIAGGNLGQKIVTDEYVRRRRDGIARRGSEGLPKAA